MQQLQFIITRIVYAPVIVGVETAQIVPRRRCLPSVAAVHFLITAINSISELIV